MIKIKYFASLSEYLDLKSEELPYSDEFNTAKDIINQLVDRGDTWKHAFSGENKILVAVNQEICEHDVAVRDGDEVAFFPPVTGG